MDGFLSVEPNAYPIVCSIIFEKRHYNPFIVVIYFELLFCNRIYTPQEICSLFKSDIDLLQEIYFYMIKNGRLVDLDGSFLIEFLSLGDNWIEEYCEFFWEDARKHIEYDCHRNVALWKSENYKKYLDCIFYHFPKDMIYTWGVGYAFKHALIEVADDDMIKQRQQEWVNHIVVDNISSDKIVSIFKFICELNENVRRNAIKVFLDNNQNFEIFSELQLVPNHWSGTGSLVPAYQKWIDFLESLYPFVQGVKFLQHKAYIKSRVEELREMIKHEEIEEICRNLYM